MIGTPQRFSIRLSLGAALLLACAGQDKSAQERTEAVGNPADMFINRVWRVQTSSGVEPGTLYAFLSGGAPRHRVPARNAVVRLVEILGGHLDADRRGPISSSRCADIDAS